MDNNAVENTGLPIDAETIPPDNPGIADQQTLQPGAGGNGEALEPLQRHDFWGRIRTSLV